MSKEIATRMARDAEAIIKTFEELNNQLEEAIGKLKVCRAAMRDAGIGDQYPGTNPRTEEDWKNGSIAELQHADEHKKVIAIQSLKSDLRAAYQLVNIWRGEWAEVAEKYYNATGFKIPVPGIRMPNDPLFLDILKGEEGQKLIEAVIEENQRASNT